MLIVKVEIWPGGNECRKECIGKIHLINMYEPGAGYHYEKLEEFPKCSDYRGEAFAYDIRHQKDEVKTWRFNVLQHDRSNGFWKLIQSALETMLR